MRASGRVPYSDDARVGVVISVPVCSGNTTALGIEQKRRGANVAVIGMQRKPFWLFAHEGSPDAAVPATGDPRNVAGIGREPQRFSCIEPRVGVCRGKVALLIGTSVPDAHCLVMRRGSNQHAVRRPSACVDLACVPFEFSCLDGRAVTHVPYRECMSAGRHQPYAVWRQCESFDRRALVGHPFVESRSLRHVPDNDGSVLGRSDSPCAVVGDDYGCHMAFMADRVWSIFFRYNINGISIS